MYGWVEWGRESKIVEMNTQGLDTKLQRTASLRHRIILISPCFSTLASLALSQAPLCFPIPGSLAQSDITRSSCLIGLLPSPVKITPVMIFWMPTQILVVTGPVYHIRVARGNNFFWHDTHATYATLLLRKNWRPAYFRKQVYFLLYHPRNLRMMTKGIFKSLSNISLMYFN